MQYDLLIKMITVPQLITRSLIFSIKLFPIGRAPCNDVQKYRYF